MKPYALFRIDPLGHELLVYECARRSDALRGRDDYLDQAQLDHRQETYVVMGPDESYEEWDDESYCAQCQDIRVKPGETCPECLSALATYYHEED